jgi:gliding motility-associated-like protein
VEQGVYTASYTFSSASSGYTVAYVRCCRNVSINNLFNPGNQGATYSAYIPPTATFHNSSPVFNNFPPIFICLKAPLKFDHSATDADGDQLVYSLCDPFIGGDPNSPAPSNPPGPPFNNVSWLSGFSGTDPLSNNTLSIDANTGFMTGRPDMAGQFVVGVCVSEYRNGVLIATYLRDFQFNVTQCNIPLADIPSTNINPATGIGVYITNCSNTFVQFQNSSYNPPDTSIHLTYQWDFGVNGINNDTSTLQAPSYNYPDTGSYLVRLCIAKGTGTNACTDTTYAYVKIYPSGVAAFSAPNVCAGTPVSFTDNSSTPQGTINAWQWNFGDGNISSVQNPSHTYSSGGTYTVTLVSANSFGCKDTMQHSEQIFNQPSSNFSYSPPCINTPVTFSLIDNTNVATYNWTLSNGSSSNVVSPVYTYTVAGTYPVSLITTSNDGCSDTTIKNLTVQLPVTAAADAVTNECKGYPVQLNASGGLYYHWIPAAGLNNPSSATPFALVDSNTSYTVVVSNDCFSDTAYTQVVVRPLPTVDAGTDTTIFRGTTVTLSGNTDGIQYYWNPSTWIDEPFSLTTKAEPQQTIWYELFAVNEYGCQSKDSVLITVESFNILDLPTAFSPNNDGVNDVFRIARWLNVYSLKEFSVFNRWGQKVFSTTNISQGWDGTLNGVPQPLGVYVWVVVYQTLDNEELVKKGNVTLVR